MGDGPRAGLLSVLERHPPRSLLGPRRKREVVPVRAALSALKFELIQMGWKHSWGRILILNISVTAFVPRPHAPVPGRVRCCVPDSVRSIRLLLTRNPRLGGRCRWARAAAWLVGGLLGDGMSGSGLFLHGLPLTCEEPPQGGNELPVGRRGAGQGASLGTSASPQRKGRPWWEARSGQSALATPLL